MTSRTRMILALAAALLGGAAPAAAQERDGVRYRAIPDGAYSVVAEVRAKPGKERALREATLPLVALVRSDPKNLVYFFQEDRETPGRFIFYEIFATRDDFEAHNAMPYVQQWFGRLPELAEGGVVVRRLEILGHGGG
ncbi:quinol monooxygenase YgiN [Bradyrhizobium japonicum USDA 38]|uniref:putative quinol monooxygenase n=1 Tax=Bradyrhizobium TaxID=374 RepID=UPI001FDA2C84|nr:MULTISPECIES: putative quinol monooxygenase [Bradyrhizobium]MCS3894400.1 quinol monooxygenase YgiN [Bradyrhizobium japonicum USDA 38]MCS3946914.1 quinol monooxygenase YgiN [Bradyrhizobium japonicum]MCW2220311.1 quinol monooxygenase YgiN [Bradyrhizobium japonicum]MCW2344925.1 quinol monooxygenase YgiN [Bradyrhizobium japonicum]